MQRVSFYYEAGKRARTGGSRALLAGLEGILQVLPGQELSHDGKQKNGMSGFPFRVSHGSSPSRLQVPGSRSGLEFGIWDLGFQPVCRLSVLSPLFRSAVSCQLPVVYCLLSVVCFLRPFALISSVGPTTSVKKRIHSTATISSASAIGGCPKPDI